MGKTRDSEGWVFDMTKRNVQGPRADFCISGLFYKMETRWFPLPEPKARLNQASTGKVFLGTTTVWLSWPWPSCCALPCPELSAGVIPSESSRRGRAYSCPQYYGGENGSWTKLSDLLGFKCKSWDLNPGWCTSFSSLSTTGVSYTGCFQRFISKPPRVRRS